MRPDQERAHNGPEESERFIVRLDGCTPTPLASYLKALGILRLVAEQKDPSARGWWEDDLFHLESVLDREGLNTFFLEEYEPTPILAPWNGGSGFYPKDNRKAIEPLRDGSADRFLTLRDTIRDIEHRVRDKGLEARPDPGKDKHDFVAELRNTATDDFLVWLDAAIAMSTEDLMYPPLLGTGGNDGRLDFTNNFLSNLVAVMDPDTGVPTDDSEGYLENVLYASPATDLQKSAIGQFAPGSAGGPNAASGFEGSALLNPWDFVLMLEGSVLLASSTARRLESVGHGVLAFPFTVRSTGAGSGAATVADEGPARAETWMPLWSRPCGIRGLAHLLAEGRIVLDARMPRDGLDAVRAMAKLGVDRGIESFQRFGYLQRSGLNYLATPLGRVLVSRNPDGDLIDQLERGRWLDRFRRMARDGAPARLTRLLRRLEAAIFDLTDGTATSGHLQRCLIALGEIQGYLSSSPTAREKSGVPIPVLSEEWLRKADDGSPEYAIATGLAALHGVQHPRGEELSKGKRVLTMAEYMAPLDSNPRRRRWVEGGHNRVVWAGGALDRNLARVVSRRLLDQGDMKLRDLPLRGDTFLPVELVAEWLIRPDWDRRIAELLPGLALVGSTKPRAVASHGTGFAAPAAYSLLKPFFVPATELQAAMHSAYRPPDPIRLPSPAVLVRLLRANDPHRAFIWARTHLRARGLSAPTVSPARIPGRGTRLLAALMVPIRRKDLNSILTGYFNPEGDHHRTDGRDDHHLTASPDAGAPVSITFSTDD